MIVYSEFAPGVIPGICLGGVTGIAVSGTYAAIGYYTEWATVTEATAFAFGGVFTGIVAGAQAGYYNPQNFQ